jgi:hypothetical protein
MFGAGKADFEPESKAALDEVAHLSRIGAPEADVRWPYCLDGVLDSTCGSFDRVAAVVKALTKTLPSP